MGLGLKSESPARALPRSASCGGYSLHPLEQELQSELDLTRVVRSIAGGPDFAKVRTGIVTGVSDGYDAVAPEVRRVEVRMIEDVKDLRPELKRVAFLDGGCS